jgi:hypothetical protein
MRSTPGFSFLFLFFQRRTFGELISERFFFLVVSCYRSCYFIVGVWCEVANANDVSDGHTLFELIRHRFRI